MQAAIIVMKKILFLAYRVAICFSQCVHDEFIKNTTKHYYDDLSDRRMLQGLGIGPLRIFADYSQVVVGDQTQKHIIKRIMNITTNYFYKLLQVDRLSKLYYPSGSSLQCKNPFIQVTFWLFLLFTALLD